MTDYTPEKVADLITEARDLNEPVMDGEMRVEVALYDVLNKTLGASLPTVAARQRAAIMPLVRRAQAEAEKAVLVKVAENAEELQHAREEVRERIYNGYSVDWSDGYDAACGDIAKWARRLIENEGAGA